jgi:hypothetical protein
MDRLVKFKVSCQVGQDDAVTFPEASDSSVSELELFPSPHVH